MQSTLDQVESKLKKLLQMAAKGTANEKISASKLIHKLASKYGIDVEKLSQAPKQFKMRAGGWRLSLLMQLCAVVCGTEGFVAKRSQTKGECIIECKEDQWLEVIAKFKILEKDYKEQLSLFYEAFIVKNNLALKMTQSDGCQTQDESKRARQVQKLASGIEQSDIRKKKDELKICFNSK